MSFQPAYTVFFYIKVLNVLFMTLLAKIHTIKICLEFAKIPMKQAYMESKHKFWHSVQVHNHNLLNRHSAAAVSRPHVTSETMIKSFSATWIQYEDY